jgi:hypothetical protein
MVLESLRLTLSPRCKVPIQASTQSGDTNADVVTENTKILPQSFQASTLK